MRDTIPFPQRRASVIPSAYEDDDLSTDAPGVSEGYGAPPVVAVMVASDPGGWFEETLDSLARVEYGNFSVLVIDNGGIDGVDGSGADGVDPDGGPTAPLAERIASVLPSAFVKRVTAGRGFSFTANEALGSVEGAAFYLLCHDDVRLEPDAVTEMVAEAFRSNAGIVGPKLVDWDQPELLRSVGIRVDPFGFSSPIAEVGELDQSQHDSPRAVFAVSDACMLIRADLFATLRGFDSDIPFFGEDVDLCWRAHIAGASVSFSASAIVGHRERFVERSGMANSGRLQIRHEARSMLKNYSLRRLFWVAPAALLFSVVDLVVSVLLGRFQRAGDIASSWAWNVAHLPSLPRARSVTRKARVVPDRDYVLLMRQGSSRLRTLFRASDGDSRLQSLALSSRGYLREAAARSRRTAAVLFVVGLVVLAYGSRHLFFGSLPAMREMPLLGHKPGGMLSEWFNGWRGSGFGDPSVGPGAVPFAGLVGWILAGSLGAARRLLILGPIVLGAVGAWKLLARSGSSAARAAMLLAYGLSPIALNALSAGRGGALAIYAAAPWILRRIATGAAIPPFAEPATSAASSANPPSPISPMRVVGGSALILGAVVWFTPLGGAVLVLTLVVISIVLGAMVDRRGGIRMLGLTAASAVGAALVGSPWLVTVLRSGDITAFSGLYHTGVASPSAARIITGSVGLLRTGALGWGVVLAGLFCLFAARSWRLGWAVASWIVALAAWIIAALLAKGAMFGGAGLEVVLVPAALALSLAIGVGVLAFEEDVIGSDFGSRQILAGVSLFALALGVVPIAIASLDGRWYLPKGDFDSVLEPVDNGRDFRTVWIGDSDVLPVAGWRLGRSDLSIGTSMGLTPVLTDRYRSSAKPGIKALEKSIQAALDGQTSRLGRLLGPMGIRYVIVVDRPNPLPYSPRQAAMPEELVTALRSQLDLTGIDVNPGMAMFRVDDEWPLRAALPSGEQAQPDRSLRDQVWFGQPVPKPVLGTGPGTLFRGELKAGEVVSQSVNGDPGWSLATAGRMAKRSDWRGWAQKFTVAADGKAELRWKTPMSARLLQVIQLAALIGLAVMTLPRRGQRVRITTKSAVSSRTETPILSVGPKRRDQPSGSRANGDPSDE